MPQLPPPLRAGIGLAATVVTEAQRLPERALGVPTVAVGAALRLAMRAQQQFTALVTRGDEVLSMLHSTPEEPPGWATFDDDLPPDPVAAPPGPAPLEAEDTPRPRARTAAERQRKLSAPAARNRAPSAFDAAADEIAD